MSFDDAARILGVPADAGASTVRARYLERLLVVHPDHNRSADATERTIEINAAYRTLLGRPTPRQPSSPPHPSAPPSAPAEEPLAVGDWWGPVGIQLLDDDTIAVHAPGGETVLRMIEAAGDLGEITFCDPSLGMVQVVIEFLEAPTAQILMTTQDRGDGSTEVFCSVDPFDGGEVPATRPVVEIIADALAST